MHTDFQKNIQLAGAVPITTIKNPCKSVFIRVQKSMRTRVLGGCRLEMLVRKQDVAPLQCRDGNAVASRALSASVDAELDTL